VRRLSAVALFAGLVAGALAGCSSGGSSADGSASPVPIASVLASMDATASPTYGPLRVVGSAPQGAQLLAWSPIRIDRDSGRIYLAADQDGCTTPWAAVVDETATTVTISIVTHGPAPSGIPCTAQHSTIVGYVKVAQPLGDRQVLHGPA
jgi:hypothetical protein